MKYLLLYTLSILLVFGLKAQEKNRNDTDGGSSLAQVDSLEKKSLSLTIGSTYTSRVAFWGRQFGIEQYGIYPYVLLNSGQGWYLYVMGLYWSAIPGQMAETDIGVGYERQVTPEFYARVGYERWISHYGNKSSRKVLTNSLEAYLSYHFKELFYIDLAAYYMIGTEQALVFDISLNTYYNLLPSLSDTIHISIVPEILTTFATHAFVRLFGETYGDVNDRKFSLIGFEINAPVSIAFGNFEVILSPQWRMI